MENDGRSALRKRFCDYMVLRRLAEKTEEAYPGAVEALVRYYRRSPDQLSNAEVHAYLVHLVQDRELAWSSCNVRSAALRVLYRGVLGWDHLRFWIPPRVRRTRRPEVLSLQEVQRLLESARSVKHRALLMTPYSAGLRVSEVVRLKPTDIESDGMLIRVRQGKGKKDRYTIVAERLLEELRQYWKLYRPGEWLFARPDRTGPIAIRTARKAYHQAHEAAGISHGRSIHARRHSLGTHLLEAGVDLMTIRQ